MILISIFNTNLKISIFLINPNPSVDCLSHCCYFLLYVVVSVFLSVHRNSLSLIILSVFIQHLCTLKNCVFTPSVQFVTSIFILFYSSPHLL